MKLLKTKINHRVAIVMLLLTAILTVLATLCIDNDRQEHPKRAYVVGNVNPVDLSAKETYILGQTEEQTTIEETTVEEETTEKHTYFDIKLSDAEQDIINSVCREFGIDNKLVYAMAIVESDCDYKSVGDSEESYGLMQIQPKWWNHYFKQYGCTDWLDIKDNVTVACAIIEQLLNEYDGNTRNMLNAYNTGSGSCHNGYADKVFAELKNLEIR